MTRAGRTAFAAVLIALGVQGLITGRFTPVWQPVPPNVPAREVLAYLCAVVSLACGAGLLWRRTARSAARALLALLVVWLIVFRGGDIVRDPKSFGSWDGCAETAVIVAAAWLLSGLPASVARVLFGLSLVAFGAGHFVYPKETAALVPHWLPAHLPWAYATGCAFLAAAVAVLINVRTRLAASLAALEIGLFTVLVWVPIVFAGSPTRSDWSEFGISAALAAGAWVVAELAETAEGNYHRPDRVTGFG